MPTQRGPDGRFMPYGMEAQTWIPHWARHYRTNTSELIEILVSVAKEHTASQLESHASYLKHCESTELTNYTGPPHYVQRAQRQLQLILKFRHEWEAHAKAGWTEWPEQPPF